MTDEQLERMVSEAIEPIPSELTWQAGPQTCAGYDATGAVRYISALDGWWMSEKFWMEWQPAPWLTDDRYAMRLFDEMGATMSFHHAWLLTQEQMMALRDRFINQTPDYRRRAIVLAFLAWKGISLEGGTE